MQALSQLDGPAWFNVAQQGRNAVNAVNAVE